MQAQRINLYRPLAVCDYTGINAVTLRSWHNRGDLETEVDEIVSWAELGSDEIVRLGRALGFPTPDRAARHAVSVRDQLKDLLAGGHRVYTRNDILVLDVMRLLTTKFSMSVETAKLSLVHLPEFAESLKGKWRGKDRYEDRFFTLAVGHNDEKPEPEPIGFESHLGDYDAFLRINCSAIARRLAERMEASEIGPAFVLTINGEPKLERC